MVKDLTYLSYPLPEDVERLVYSGDLTRARSVIDRRLADPKVPDCLKERLRFELRIIDEIPRTYTRCSPASRTPSTASPARKWTPCATRARWIGC